MKRFAALALAAIVFISISGCAGSKQGVQVKCPACGYEFEAPAQNQ